jgi:hypothetical protein
MSSPTLRERLVSRRQFLMWSAGSGSLLALAACAAVPAAPPTGASQPAAPQATQPPPTEVPAPAAAPTMDQDEVVVMVRDVLDYKLEPDGWEGPYGQVTFRLHEGLHNDESVYFITTDASDPMMAEQMGLVYVPLLNVAQSMENVNIMYQFMDGRPSVFKWIPGDEHYSSLFHCTPVTTDDASLELSSVEAIEQAIQEGSVTATQTPVFVNFPFIKWPGGGLSVDPELKDVLPGGQLFEEADLTNMTVTMKLHQCYPGSRYILTDTGAAPMAPMMNIPAAAPTQQLKALGGTDEIWVFGNGIPGPGVMGFQPAIFDNKAGQPAWSPFWDHFTVTWTDPNAARVLTSSAEVRELVKSGELEEWNGTPDSHPEGFVVNCPAPILAPTTFEG